MYFFNFRFTANFQRPPSKLPNKTDQKDGFDDNNIGFKNVSIDSDDHDSDEEFVNIMMPLFGEQANNEAKITAMRDYLTQSAELRQRKGK